MQSALRRRGGREPCAGCKLMSLATLYTHGLNPTLRRTKSVASLPVQKSQSSERRTSIMAFGVTLPRFTTGLEPAAQRGSAIRGSFSTKFEKVKLVADRKRSLLEHINWKDTLLEEDSRAGLIFSYRDSNTAKLEVVSSGSSDCSLVGGSERAFLIDRSLGIKTSSEHEARVAAKAADMDVESELSPVEGDIWDRVCKLRQAISDYSYRYHTLDNPVVR